MNTTTKHNHEPLAFGRKLDKGLCPRCDELHNGAAPRKGWGQSKRERDLQSVREVRAHYASHKHKSGGCGLMCTFGEW